MDSVGAVFTAECGEMNEMGSGIVRYGSMVVFVPGLVTGDTAEIRIESLGKNYAIGKCLSLIRRSPHRIDGLCPDESVCGGCTLGHISYDLENKVKRNTVKSAFRRAGLRDVEPEETLFGETRYGYRNKMTLRFDPASQRFGYSRENTAQVLPFHGCPLCPAAFSEIVLSLNDRPELTVPLAPEALRLRSGEDGLTVTVSGHTEDQDAAVRLTEVLCGITPGTSVLFERSDNGRRWLTSGQGAEIRDIVAGLELRFSAEAFRQVNTPVFEKRLELVLSMAGEKSFRRAADLYCGSGVIGLALAKAFPSARITGVEINPDAVEDAKKNAAYNGLGNIRFFAGDAASFRRRISEGEGPELVTVDPPRAGLSGKMKRELISLGPERIIYVSCNPQTLARDARELTDAGYAVGRVVPVNMFPATKHVETVCCLYHQKKDFISVPYEPQNTDYLQQLK